MGLTLQTNQQENKSVMRLTCDIDGCDREQTFDMNKVSVMDALKTASDLGWLERKEGPPRGRTLRLCPVHSGKGMKRKR